MKSSKRKPVVERIGDMVQGKESPDWAAVATVLKKEGYRSRSDSVLGPQHVARMWKWRKGAVKPTTRKKSMVVAKKRGGLGRSLRHPAETQTEETVRLSFADMLASLSSRGIDIKSLSFEGGRTRFSAVTTVDSTF